jgi:inosine/xanthosine triphosphate pyrophosphatase family protein
LRLAQGLPSRTSRFVGALIYMDEDGTPHSFIDRRSVGTLAREAESTRSPDAWSALWSIFIPEGASRPLAALPSAEREALFTRWRDHSVYAQFARWLSDRPGARGTG